MKAMKIMLAMVMGTLLVAACLPEPLPVGDIPKLQPKIVVSSQIIPTQGLVVLITKSIGALDAGRDSDPEALLAQIVINNAKVTLQSSNQVDTLVNLGNGLYGGLTFDLADGATYTLHVVTDSLGEVTASSQVKQRVPFQSADASVYSNGYDSLASIDYSLNDPAGKNYYMINVQRFSRTQDVNSLLSQRIFTRLKEDTDFDGQYFQEEFKVFFQDYSVGDTVAVLLSNINKDYYDFMKLRNDNRYNIADFASEPTNYPTNVNGGYGFFNLHVPDVRLFVLK
ncbi:MAG: hypothetical protein DI538_20790 [Azospira oryzae]|jgi:hypothetical protein|nr:MAG: hypothetical protein DI538_20790 [Azospira oryzae]